MKQTQPFFQILFVRLRHCDGGYVTLGACIFSCARGAQTYADIFTCCDMQMCSPQNDWYSVREVGVTLYTSYRCWWDVIANLLKYHHGSMFATVNSTHWGCKLGLCVCVCVCVKSFLPSHNLSGALSRVSTQAARGPMSHLTCPAASCWGCTAD